MILVKYFLKKDHYIVFKSQFICYSIMASLVAQLVKNPPAMRETGFDPWVGEIPWRRERLRTPVLWPGEAHGLYSRRVGHGWAALTVTHMVLVTAATIYWAEVYDIVRHLENKLLTNMYLCTSGCSGSLLRGGYPLLRSAGFSLQRLPLLRSTGCRCSGFSQCGLSGCSSQVVKHELRSCDAQA